jgi:hypothetical protein
MDARRRGVEQWSEIGVRRDLVSTRQRNGFGKQRGTRLVAANCRDRRQLVERAV